MRKWLLGSLLVYSASITVVHAATSQQMPWPSQGFPNNSTNNFVNNNSASAGGDLSGSSAVTTAEQMATAIAQNKLGSLNLPEWLQRTDFDFYLAEDSKPVTSLETIQPIYEIGGHTVFWQGRVAYSGADETYNLGAGYRYLLDSKNWMWGVNTFYDRTQRYSHQRVGVGGELFGKYFTLRSNYYDAISGRKNVGPAADGVTQYEKALSGWDYSIETPIPYVPWMRFSAQEYHWTGDVLANVNGTSVSLLTYPTKTLEVDVGVSHDNEYGQQAFVRADLYLGKPAFITQAATTSSYGAAFVPRDLEQYRLQKVLRHNDIVVEKTSASTTGSSIIIARGN